MEKRDFEETARNLAGRIPFHWKIDFEKVLAGGGFDVVVGNPPYVEDRNYSEIDLKIIKSSKKVKRRRKRVKKPLFYHSRDCGNTHAYFIERSIKLLKQKGRFGFIVPLALVSTDRMKHIREFIHGNSSDVKYYNFDDRPGKIFSGLEHCRATIVVTGKGTGVEKITTSKYHRWFTKDRSKLFEDLKTTEWGIVSLEDTIPKIGTKIEISILDKLQQKSDEKTIGDSIEDEGTMIWYHNAPQYWIHAHTQDYLPMVEYFDGYKEDSKTGEKIPNNLVETKISSHYKPLILDPQNSSIINGLLNSSLFYWWFVIWSDGRDLLKKHIESFYIDVGKFPEDLKEKLEPLVHELMERYDENSNIKINQRSEGYVIKIKEIIPSKSFRIIDQIDDVFADYFEFTEEQKDFIKKFDIEFRIKD